MSKIRFLAWSVLLSLPLQYLSLLVPIVFELSTAGVPDSDGAGDFGCRNYHDPDLTPCSFTAMLVSPLVGIVVLNAISVGLFGLTYVGVSALLLGLGIIVRQIFSSAREDTQ